MDQEITERTVYKCGTNVIIKHGANVEGIIVGIIIRYEAISYEISYFMGGEFRRNVFVRDELIIDDKRCNKIGFNYELKTETNEKN